MIINGNIVNIYKLQKHLYTSTSSNIFHRRYKKKRYFILRIASKTQVKRYQNKILNFSMIY